MTCKATIIYNPAAGPWDMSRTLRRLATYLTRHDWQTTLVHTTQAGDAVAHARTAAADGVDLVLVAGGDGTINEAANGLSGTATALGIIPIGTGNILAHQLRMPVLGIATPLQIKEVGEALVRGRIQRVDLGEANKRAFLCWAGIGLDAEIATQIEPRPRHLKRLKNLPYIAAALTIAPEYRGVRTDLEIEGIDLHTRTLIAVASNIQLYAAFFNIAPQAKMDDGQLDIFVFKGVGITYALKYIVQSFGGRHLQSPDVMHALAAHMTVETSPATAVHVDGEPFGCTPVTIGLRRRALRLLVPPNAPETLFKTAPERLITS